MEQTYPPGELDDLAKNEHQHQEPLVHHHREEHGMENDPAHQMMDNYVSTSSFFTGRHAASYNCDFYKPDPKLEEGIGVRVGVSARKSVTICQ